MKIIEMLSAYERSERVLVNDVYFRLIKFMEINQDVRKPRPLLRAKQNIDRNSQLISLVVHIKSF